MLPVPLPLPLALGDLDLLALSRKTSRSLLGGVGGISASLVSIRASSSIMAMARPGAAVSKSVPRGPVREVDGDREEKGDGGRSDPGIPFPFDGERRKALTGES